MPTNPPQLPAPTTALRAVPWALLVGTALACAETGAAPATVAPGATAPVARAPESPPGEAGEPSGDATLAGPGPGQPPSPPTGDATPATEPTSVEPPPAAPPERVALPAGTKVLHVGDSFAGALGIPLGEMLEQAGVRSVLKHKDSSYLTTWAWEPELAQDIWRYNPDLVVITLGANELAIADPAQREKTVRKIVSTIGQRPCLWVAIPLWSERHNGLLEVIEAASKPCVFYDTNEKLDTLAMPRIHDGIHPTNAARHAWAEAVFDYLLTHRRPREGAPWWLVE